MADMVLQSPLDRLQGLMSGKPTASEFQDSGEAFRPQFHFLSLLPSPALPPSEVGRVQHYFDAVFEALMPVRDLISAYRLKGVMSRTPISDFSLEVQFSDAHVVGLVRRSLPRELSGCVVTYQRRCETTPTSPLENNMFSRVETRQENRDQMSSMQSPAQEHIPEHSMQEQVSASRVPITIPAPSPLEAHFESTAPIVAPTPPPKSGRKKLVVPEGVTLRGSDILGCAYLAIEGEAYLKIDHCEKLDVLQNGIFEGAATVLEAEISGLCKGTLVVKGTLRITGTGHVVGSIQYGYLQVESGGRIEGEMKIPMRASEIGAQTPSDHPHWVDLNEKLSA